jgi:hypothetical protein
VANVYSYLLTEQHSVPTGGWDLGLPPLGFKWIVNDVVVTHPDAGAQAKGGFRIRDDGNVTVLAVYQPFALSGQTYHWSGRQVLEAGDHLTFDTLDVGWDVRISGYQLALP